MQTWITKKATHKRFAALSQWDLPPGTIKSYWQFLFGLSLHLMCSTVLKKAFSHFWTSFIVWEHSRVLHACMIIVVTLALVSAFLLCWTQKHSALGAKWFHQYSKECLFNANWKVYISSRYSDLRNLSQAKMDLNQCVFWSPGCLLQHLTCSSFTAACSPCKVYGFHFESCAYFEC